MILVFKKMVGCLKKQSKKVDEGVRKLHERLIFIVFYAEERYAAKTYKNRPTTMAPTIENNSQAHNYA